VFATAPPWGSKCLINACMDYRYIKSFSNRAKLSKRAYDNVAARWNEFGFDGTAPKVLLFEDKEFPETMGGSQFFERM
jgi:hypothetical protein